MRTLIITGASGGLGRTVTRHFLDRQWRVAVIVSQPESLDALGPHPNLHGYVADLTQEEQTAAVIRTIIYEQGPVDGALLLAGGFAMGSLSETGLEGIQKMLAINFHTAYTVVRPLFAHMKEQGRGRIVLTGARPAIQPAAAHKMLAYSLSKSLLFRLAECLNEEARGSDVVTTVLVPSTIATPANREAMPDADPADWVSPGEIAAVLDFLLSDAATPLREPVMKVYKNS